MALKPTGSAAYYAKTLNQPSQGLGSLFTNPINPLSVALLGHQLYKGYSGRKTAERQKMDNLGRLTLDEMRKAGADPYEQFPIDTFDPNTNPNMISEFSSAMESGDGTLSPEEWAEEKQLDAVDQSIWKWREQNQDVMQKAYDDFLGTGLDYADYKKRNTSDPDFGDPKSTGNDPFAGFESTIPTPEEEFQALEKEAQIAKVSKVLENNPNATAADIKTVLEAYDVSPEVLAEVLDGAQSVEEYIANRDGTSSGGEPELPVDEGDIVRAQLEQAIEAETDPELRAKLETDYADIYGATYNPNNPTTPGYSNEVLTTLEEPKVWADLNDDQRKIKIVDWYDWKTGKNGGTAPTEEEVIRAAGENNIDLSTVRAALPNVLKNTHVMPDGSVMPGATHTGADGADGAAGAAGVDGAEGAAGAAGVDGAAGISGADGTDGTSGADGKDGKDGIGMLGSMVPVGTSTTDKLFDHEFVAKYVRKPKLLDRLQDTNNLFRYLG